MSANPAEEQSAQASFLRCEDEPIRIPGSIQRHGFLLLLDPTGEHVSGASQNVEDFLRVPVSVILGTPVATLLEREVLGALRSTTTSAAAPEAQTYLGSFLMRGRYYSVVIHLVGQERIVEFERLEHLVSPEMANQVFTNFVSKLNLLHTEYDLCEALAQRVRTLTGFNRVVLYRFDEAGHGHVIAEDNDGTLESFLGLRFPASDIPRQARELYVLNSVRIIPNALYEPSPLVGQHDRKLQSLDLSQSLLRSVSPIHVEYMRNMGTLSSMSISIVCDGKLWGLISCHHATAHEVPYLVRSACDLLTKLVATQLITLRTSANMVRMVHFHSVQRRVLTEMVANSNYLAALADRLEDLIEITGANGVALVQEDHCTSFGQCPGEADILKLAAWRNTQRDVEIFHTRELQKEIAWASEIAGVASGLLAIRISDVRPSYLMWFRPEVANTIHWAGEPKSAEEQPTDLSPRKSFAAWQQLVLGRSKAWSQIEIDSAVEFRGALTTISLRRAEEAAHLSEARFLQLTHALPHPVWTATDDGELTYVNQTWLDHGLTDQGCWYEQKAIFKQDQARCDEVWKKSVAKGQPFEIELRLCPPAHADSLQPDRWNLARVAPYRNVAGELAGWLGTFTDLTERRQRELAVRMTEKLALTGRMTSVIAHEINNPLEALGNLLFLLDSLQTDESARNYIGLAEAELQRISAITKQTLRWSKEGVQKPRYGTVSELFENILRIYAGKIRNREAIVNIVGGEDLQFFGAVGQVEQVIANLLSNAIQAISAGGHIWLNAIHEDDKVHITVRDDGQGMSDETIRNLFQPFYSTKGDLGNGLGLFISHEIVERNGGRLFVSSELGKGTQVRVELPASSPSDMEQEVNATV